MADSPLVYAAAPVAPSAVADARRLAYASGRVLERDGASLFALGEATRLELPLGTADGAAIDAAISRLATLVPLDGASRPGGPLAVGALAFDPAGYGELVVPALAVLSRGDHHEAVAVGTEGAVRAALATFPFATGAPPPPPPTAAAGEPPDRFELVSARPHADFRDKVAHAVEAIRAGGLDKVVLAREVTVVANRPFLQHHLLERLRALHPGCLAYAVDGFVGASPELLVRRRGDEVASQPLAGTVARSGDPDEDRHLAAALLASGKERAEHRFVVEAILDALGPDCSSLEAPDTPHLLALRNVAHLATRVTGTLRRDPGGAAPSALHLAARLHPTPAVGGSPRDEALAYLAKHEELDRDRYAGPVGWVRADGDGEWWIGIRSALLDGRRARLVAGVGIVEGSEPAAELAETQLKLQALLAAAVRP